ncbi:hypothetical protein OC834_001932 [Tilletia horrida]|uniref:peptidyl-tRNA hydrolase n=1 Tax=Tilletia horrida TaxID=155126 RepID=A0AAN6GF58_9BASI|nr:hypothetical protein OC842_002901 [Tilletia horrida]KAK0534363.1 hypothetical protein OC834_001932 [Tilletia horrida]KAK0537699.1 hypothetical protein OC835_001671 [Tilletia horrida]
MDLTALRELLLSPVVTTSTAVAVSSFIIGYYAGVGRSLFAYNETTRRRLAAASDDEDEEGEGDTDEDEAFSDDKMVRSKAGMLLEECKMMLVVRTDLKMDKGKIAAQCGHATLAAYKAALRNTPEYVQQWERLGQAKVAVKCSSEQELLEVEQRAKKFGVVAKSITDAGRTQIPAGTRTVVGVGPGPVSLMDKITGGFKLL